MDKDIIISILLGLIIALLLNYNFTTPTIVIEKDIDE